MNPDSFLRITEVSQSGSNVLVCNDTVTTEIYTFESKDSLTIPNSTWQIRYFFTNGMDGIVQMMDTGTASAATNRFYHVVTVAPGWYPGGTLNNNYSLQPGLAYLFLNNSPTLKRWRQAVPY